MKIFVYGSLMHGFFNYEKYLVGKVKSRNIGKTVGTLYHLGNKGYPGFIDSGDHQVYGEIIDIEDDEDTLAAIYKLEDCVVNNQINNSYNRKAIKVFDTESNECIEIEAFIYSLDSDKNTGDSRVLIEHGSWRQYMEQNI